MSNSIETREEDIFAEEETPTEEVAAEEEMTEEAPMEEGAEMEGEEEAGAPTMVHTEDEIPQLSGLEIGDTITFSITNITDDGSYEMTPELPATEEGIGGAEAGGGGRGAVEEALL